MKRKLKKYFLSFGALGALSMATISLISCGSQIINNQFFGILKREFWLLILIKKTLTLLQ